MQTKIIIETERLFLREFELKDADFILKLVNAPNWLEFLGDKQIRTNLQAEEYLKNSLLKSYKDNGFGLWLVGLKDSNVPIGMCGLVDRDSLDDVDIGFALLPQYSKLGYGLEAASATMNYAKHVLKLPKVVGITDPPNKASISLLNKIGLRFEKTLQLAENNTVLLFSPTNDKADRIEIARLSASFFDLFTNTNQQIPNLDSIKDLCVPTAIIINNSTGMPDVYSLAEFIAPRKKILTDGTLTDFSERELTSNTEIFGTIAQRFSLYEKSGKQNGTYFESRGVKTIQFLKLNGAWKISSVAWCDEK